MLRVPCRRELTNQGAAGDFQINEAFTRGDGYDDGGEREEYDRLGARVPSQRRSATPLRDEGEHLDRGKVSDRDQDSSQRR